MPNILGSLCIKESPQKSGSWICSTGWSHSLFLAELPAAKLGEIYVHEPNRLFTFRQAEEMPKFVIVARRESFDSLHYSRFVKSRAANLE
jgi:hypothetical protein